MANNSVTDEEKQADLDEDNSSVKKVKIQKNPAQDVLPHQDHGYAWVVVFG